MTYRTDEATLSANAKASWAVAEETSKTDCVASAVDPNLTYDQ